MIVWQILEACRAQKMMVRYAAHPGGNINVAIYPNKEQTEQFIYDSKDMATIEREMMKDWSHLMTPEPPKVIEQAEIVKKMLPVPPGFPKPPGVR